MRPVIDLGSQIGEFGRGESSDAESLRVKVRVADGNMWVMSLLWIMRSSGPMRSTLQLPRSKKAECGVGPRIRRVSSADVATNEELIALVGHSIEPDLH